MNVIPHIMEECPSDYSDNHTNASSGARTPAILVTPPEPVYASIDRPSLRPITPIQYLPPEPRFAASLQLFPPYGYFPPPGFGNPFPYDNRFSNRGSPPSSSQDILNSEGMKRALDTAGLPLKPNTDYAAYIDQPLDSHFKRPRQDPSAPPIVAPVSHLPPPFFGPHTGALGYNNMTTTGPMMAGPSPIHLGGPLPDLIQPGGPNIAPGLHTPLTANSANGFNGSGYSSYMYPGAPVISPAMNPNTMTGNYGPAAAAAAAYAARNVTGRTVYVGSLPSEASVDELLNLVRFGPIENVRIIPEKSCVFISFLDGCTAAAFHADANVKKLALHGTELKIGWGKPSIVPTTIAQAVVSYQATRNVFIGNLSETTNEQDLRNVCQNFGPIDQVKIVRDKNIGFVHFLSIATAIKVVNELPLQPGWADKRVNYGKDRCAYVPKAQQAAVKAAQAQAAAAIASHHAQLPGAPFSPFSPVTPSFGGLPTAQPGFSSPPFSANGFAPMGDMTQVGNRNVYLGNIHPDTTTEELCNNIRGGTIAVIRHMKDKNIAFVTFADAQSAMQFYTNATVIGLTINHRRLKVGWGKHSGPLSPVQLQAIQSGATRNVYIGQIEDMSVLTEEKLRQDFAEYGDIEMINFLNERKAAFVNFTSVTAAIKAVEGIRVREDYAMYRIAYGKDRCANPPRGSHGDRMGPRTSPNRGDRDTPKNSSSGNASSDEASEPVIAKAEPVIGTVENANEKPTEVTLK